MRRFARNAVLCVVAAVAVGCVGEPRPGHQGPEAPADDPADVEIDEFTDHNDCPGSGLEVLIDDEPAAVVCDGEDAEAPTVEASRVEEHEECPAGGVEVRIDGEVEDVVCDGEDGEAANIEINEHQNHPDCPAGGVDIVVDGQSEAVVCDGEDGTDGQTPSIDAEHLEDHPACPAGGLEVIFEFDDAADVEAHVCDGTDGEDGDVSGITVHDIDDLEGFGDECDESGGYVLEIQKGDGAAAYHVVCRNEEDDNGDDEPAPPATVAFWDFVPTNGDESALQPVEGEGTAVFSDGDAAEPFGSSTVSSTHDSWYSSAWSTTEDSPADDPTGHEYFEFRSDAFTDTSDVFLEASFHRTGSGPQELQIAAEFEDGDLAFLEESVLVEEEASYDVPNIDSRDMSPDGFEDAPEGEDIVAYRFYGFDSDGTNFHLHYVEFYEETNN